ncbi:MAG TPA: response regulator [Candidatus Saccharimonadales bacterium]|nr:response regulator [Candidatus Saccharimonadales bacterium]
MAEPKRILFIEDDTPVADMYTEELKSKGFQVEVVADGTTGLKRATNNHYDILLIDLMIPKPDGVEVVNRLRGKDGTGLRNSKLVVFTNVVLDDKAFQKLNSQVDKYLIKANTIPSKLVEELNSL